MFLTSLFLHAFKVCLFSYIRISVVFDFLQYLSNVIGSILPVTHVTVFWLTTAVYHRKSFNLPNSVKSLVDS